MKITLSIECLNADELAAIAGALRTLQDDHAQDALAPEPKARAKAKTVKPETVKPETTCDAAPEATAVGETVGETVEEPEPTESDIMDAANRAVPAVGMGGPAKVQAYIAKHFTKPDGSPGTLKTTAPGQRARLLRELSGIAAGKITP